MNVFKLRPTRDLTPSHYGVPLHFQEELYKYQTGAGRERERDRARREREGDNSGTVEGYNGRKLSDSEFDEFSDLLRNLTLHRVSVRHGMGFIMDKVRDRLDVFETFTLKID